MEGKKKIQSNILPLIPLRDIVVFPHMVVPLFVGREKSIRGLENALLQEKGIVLAAQKKSKTNDPAPADIYETGTVAEILQILRLSDGTVKVLVEGLSRVKIDSFLENSSFLEVKIIFPEKKIEISQEVEALMRSLYGLFEEYVKLGQKIPLEILMLLQNINEPGHLSDAISSHLSMKALDKQKLLEITSPVDRLEELYKIIESEIEILKIERRVRGRVKKQMEQSQREYYLQEQMKAIQKELGKHNEFKSEIEELKERIKKAKMPEESHKKVLKEIKRLEMMPPMSAEGTVVRNYIDWLVDLPWVVRTKDKLNIKEAEKILNKDHYGLEKVKERVLEYLAVRQLVKKMKGPILCLVGPPGVGKTSLGKSIARAMGRKFVRVSLGGVRDEAEIRGHRRTYIGALPGRIIQSVKRAETKNPVFMLDEIDKMSMDFRGDPSAALLEVLDPEQNHAFNDHYIEVDFDLSEVMFITTANVLHTIPRPLLDRMEVLRMPGYTEDEKVNIAKLFLIPKNIKEHGLKEDYVQFSDRTIEKIIRHYTKEAGVRNLEREIANICRKVAKKVATKKAAAKKGDKKANIISSDSLSKYLGVPLYRVSKKEERSEVGLATGLAWTEVGGEILTTEVTIMDGRGKLTITGQLGDVMQESAQAALSYVRSRAKEMGLNKNFYQKIDIHIHIPEGAIPKDGPSAGITMATTLVSAITKRAVKRDIAMTGEITLRGKVLPVGGIKEKLLAAHRGEIYNIVLPRENERDLKDIPANIRKVLKINLVENMDEVLKIALEEPPAPVHEKKIKVESQERDYTPIPSPIPIN
ncbi:MAG: endopeptidase La [Nitrospinae bacterium RIFCSPLOWO2_02_39_17]|nr:MAG: endopeptidase La [Nitrospinae bacterium RIFCSPLOWO2_02_39_17]